VVAAQRDAWLGSFQAAYGKLQEWTAASAAAQRRLAERAAQVAEAVDALGAAGGAGGEGGSGGGSRATSGPAAAALGAAGQEVAAQMAGLQQLMAAEAGKHRTEFEEALEVRGLTYRGAGWPGLV
jgi:hypothetical protein